MDDVAHHGLQAILLSRCIAAVQDIADVAAADQTHYEKYGLDQDDGDEVNRYHERQQQLEQVYDALDARPDVPASYLNIYLIGLLVDLIHCARAVGLNFDAALSIAQMHFELESDETETEAREKLKSFDSIGASTYLTRC